MGAYERAIEYRKPRNRRVALDHPEFSDSLRAALRHRAQMRPDMSDRRKDRQLHAPVPHLDLGLLLGANSEQRRRRMRLFEVAADRYAFAQVRAVVEFENWQRTERIFPVKLGRSVGVAHDVNLLEGNRDPLLRQEDPDPPRTRRKREVVQLHRHTAPVGNSSSLFALRVPLDLATANFPILAVSGCA